MVNVTVGSTGITVSDASVDSVLCVLNYLYTGQLQLTSSNFWSVQVLVKELQIDSALDICHHYSVDSRPPTVLAPLLT